MAALKFARCRLGIARAPHKVTAPANAMLPEITLTTNSQAERTLRLNINSTIIVRVKFVKTHWQTLNSAFPQYTAWGLA
jgi:hypothetical protein